MILNSDRLNYNTYDIIETSNFLVIDGETYDKGTLAKLNSKPLEVGNRGETNSDKLVQTMISVPVGSTGVSDNTYHLGRLRNELGENESLVSVVDSEDSNIEWTIIGDRIIKYNLINKTFQTFPSYSTYSMTNCIFLYQDTDYIYFAANYSDTYSYITLFSLNKNDNSISNLKYLTESSTYIKFLTILKRSESNIHVNVSMQATYSNGTPKNYVYKITCTDGSFTVSKIFEETINNYNLGSNASILVDGGFYLTSEVTTNSEINFYKFEGTTDTVTKGTPVKLYEISDEGIQGGSTEFDKKFGLDVLSTDYPTPINYFELKFTGPSGTTSVKDFKLYKSESEPYYLKYISPGSDNDYTDTKVVLSLTNPNYTTKDQFVVIPESYSLAADEILVKLSRTSSDIYDITNKFSSAGIFLNSSITDLTEDYQNEYSVSKGTELAITCEVLERGSDELQSSFTHYSYVPYLDDSLTYTATSFTLEAYYTVSNKLSLGTFTKESGSIEDTVNETTPLKDLCTVDNKANYKSEFNKIVYMDSYTTDDNNLLSYDILVFGEDNKYLLLSLCNTYNKVSNTFSNAYRTYLFERIDPTNNPLKLKLLDMVLHSQLPGNTSEKYFSIKFPFKYNEEIYAARDHKGGLFKINIKDNLLDFNLAKIDNLAYLGFDSKGRLYARSSEDNSLSINKLDSIYSFILDYENPSDNFIEYKGSEITKNISIKASDIFGNDASGIIDLEILGNGAEFTGSTNKLRVTVNKGNNIVPIKFTKPSDITIVGNIIYDNDLSVIS